MPSNPNKAFLNEVFDKARREMTTNSGIDKDGRFWYEITEDNAFSESLRMQAKVSLIQMNNKLTEEQYWDMLSYLSDNNKLKMCEYYEKFPLHDIKS